MKIKYPRMKESGIEWIGKIPEHWKVKRLKFNDIKIIAGQSPPSNSYSDNHGIPFIQGCEEFNDLYPTPKIKTLKPIKIVHEKTILVSVRAPVGELNIADSKICIGRGIAGIQCKNSNMNFKFLYYFLKGTMKQLQSSSRGSTYDSIRTKDLENLWTLKISIEEQEQISKFLDNKTSKIDSLIQNKIKLIELLKEKRLTTINQTLTKGLDLKAPLKDSGVEWIGKIPEHWKLNKIKYCSYVKGRIGWQGLRSDEFTEYGPYLITGTEFKDGRIDWKSCYHVDQWRYDQDPHIQVKNGDVLITKDGTIGKVALVDGIQGQATLNSGVMMIRPINNSFLPRFMYWILQSEQFTQYVEYVKTGSTINHLYQETFENLKFSYPESFVEQEQISNFIENETSKMNNLVSKIELQIKQLKEFRQSLISSAVTGKINLNEEIIT